MTREEKRNHKMYLRNFLHGIMEHKKWNVKKSKSLKLKWMLRSLLFSYWEGRRRGDAASKPVNQDLIIINKYYNKLAYFDNVYIEIVDPVAMGKS